MKYLKPDRKITGLIPVIVLYVVFALTSVIFGVEVGFDVTGVFVLFYALGILLEYRRTINSYYLVSFSYLFLGSIWLFIFEPRMLKHYGGQFTSTALIIMVLIIFLALWLLFLLFTKKLKWKGREVMELIARGAEESEDGFTERPRPCGKLNATRLELDEYVTYLRKNLIFLVVREVDQYVLVPVKMGNEFRHLLRVNYEQYTWITINHAGEIRVHISKEDYLDYKVNLSYDQLSENLGNLVSHFFKEFQAHNEVRILDEIHSVKVGIFS
jgi:hypothetical protein